MVGFKSLATVDLSHSIVEFCIEQRAFALGEREVVLSVQPIPTTEFVRGYEMNLGRGSVLRFD
jgi:hypothetical protein